METKKVIVARLRKRKAERIKKCTDIIDLLLKMEGEARIALQYFHFREVRDALLEKYDRVGWKVVFTSDDDQIIWEIIVG